jgi:adenosylhomocysteine nucleosidase
MVTLERVDFAIVVALAIEAQPIGERLAGVVRLRAGDRRVIVGRLGSRSVAVIEAGVGRAAAEQATQLVIDGHRPRQAIISAGLCGAVDPQLPRSAIIVPDSLGHSGSADTRPLPQLLVPPGNVQPTVSGLLMTCDTVVSTSADKYTVHAATGAVAVDMESWWIATVASRSNLPCHVIRAVSDTATESIPADIAALAAVSNPARQAGAALRLAWRRPSAIGELAELREHALQAAESLADYLVAIFDKGAYVR